MVKKIRTVVDLRRTDWKGYEGTLLSEDNILYFDKV